jgi:hypothetical protein
VAGPIEAESSSHRFEGSNSHPHWSDASREPMGVPVQLCMLGLSQTGAGILWEHDHHPG